MQAGRRLYVGRIPQAATRADFEDFFGRMGKLVDVRIMAGFAFIEYADLRVRRGSSSLGMLLRSVLTRRGLQDAEEAVNELNNKDFLGDRCVHLPRCMLAPRPLELTAVFLTASWSSSPSLPVA